MANINIRIDDILKSQLQELMGDLGLDMTTYFTMAAKQAVREQAIPFNVSREIPNAETIDAFREVESMKMHPENVKSYTSFSDLLSEVEQSV